MTDVTELTVRNWVRNEVGDIKQQVSNWTNNRKDMFNSAMVALVALALVALVGFLCWDHKSDLEQCAESCGAPGMKAWTASYEVYKASLEPNATVAPHCVCYEAKQP